ncbi:MAG: 3-phosphoshikimate 1-carboxyvinyltransferase [Desulfovibrionaceae bacterium]
MDTVTVTAPSSKSLSHRALIAAALAPGESVLSDVLESRDIYATMSCLTACGAALREENGRVLVTGLEHGPLGAVEKQDPPRELFVGESGTTCRLITAVAAAGKGRFRINGEGRMPERPMGELARALAKLGPRIRWEGRPECPPLVIETDGLHGGTTSITLEESSQYLSGLLLAAPLADGPVTIEVAGKKAVSWPYVALTLTVLQDFKIPFVVEIRDGKKWAQRPWRTLKQVVPGEIRFTVTPAPYESGDWRVEGDWSNASYFLAAGALGPRTVRVDGLRAESLQGDRAILDILAAMGATTRCAPGRVTVEPRPLRGLDLDMGRCPDLVPTVAVAAALAQGPTRIRNVAHLRLKESDRLAALAREIGRTGCGVTVLEDGLAIEPAPLPPAGTVLECSSHGDHRMAMSLALFGLRGLEVRLDDPGCVDKSFPGFWSEWAKVLPRAAGGRS